MITLLEVFEEGMIQVMEIIERLECTKDTAVNFARTIEESIKTSEKKVADAAAALAQAQALAATNAAPATAAALAAQQQLQNATQVVNAGQQNALPNAVNNVAAPLTGWEKIKAFFSRGP
jgi:malate/lactate dehydrogenase